MELYLRLLKYIRPYIRTLILSTICAVFVALLTAGLAWLVKPVLDDIFIKRNYDMLNLLPIVIVVVTTLKGFFNYSQAYLMRCLGNMVVRDMRNETYQKVLDLPSEFHASNTTGSIMSRIISDIMMIQNAVSTVVKDGIQQTTTLLGLIGVIFYQDWKLAIYAVILLPVAYYPLVRFSSRLRRISKHGQKKVAEISHIIQETISGIRLVKLSCTEKIEREKFKDRNEQYFKNIMKGVHVSELSPPMMNTIGAISVAFLIWYGGKEVIAGMTTAGTFFSFITACLMMYAPIRSLTMANNKIQHALASAERVFEVMDKDTEQELDTGAKKEFFVPEKISFKNVSFKYKEEPVLKNINFEINAGGILAVVGSSGAGKSTLVNLLPRLFPVTIGSILLDETDIADIKLESLRRNIGVVSQETILFNDTIRKNISYGQNEKSMEEIIEAAKAAYLHDVIKKLPKGYDSIVGERGVNLSGGERQRIAIARALLKNPPILILDEATSALDSEAETMIQQAILNLMGGRTTFVIAHRLSTILHATKIIVIDNGSIVETGRHEELIKKKGIYRKFYNLQFHREQAEDSA